MVLQTSGRRSALFAFAFAIGLAVLVSRPAVAEIKQLVVNSVNNTGPFRGKSYREIQLTMKGVAPGGDYSVPVVLAFPNAAADYNGFAVVDILNTVTVGNPNWVLGGRIIPVARGNMGDEFLFGSGYVYVGPLWDKKAAELFQTGTIAAPADGYEIWRDAALLARNPAGAHFPTGFPLPRAADKVLAFGFSQTGGLLRGFYFRQLNTKHGDLTFDGALIASASGGCATLDEPRPPCVGPPPAGGKVITVNTESDAERGGFNERGETREFRAFEVPGTSHIPSSRTDFRGLGAPRQNPVGAFPVYRVALASLQRWISGTEPPPSIYVTLREGPPDALRGNPFRPAVRDADGNALGGVRLPHLRTTLPDGKVVGAPLGTYNGLDLAFKDTNFFFLIGGTFVPLEPDRLRTIYPTREAYVAAIDAAVKDLVAKRYLLQEDADAYVDAARQAEIGR